MQTCDVDQQFEKMAKSMKSQLCKRERKKTDEEIEKQEKKENELKQKRQLNKVVCL